MLGKGVEVVRVEGNVYVLEVEELKKILLRAEVRDLPVVVVSVAGAYRGGKSFLLNFFLKYNSAPLSSQLDGTWLGEEHAPLEGFSWRGGADRNTTGIVIWSEPIVATLSTGEKVCVILMDTQGTFDSSSTVKDCSTIFALSTLLSSVQIYNLSQNIGEDNLQHLELFTSYGSLVRDKNSDTKAFQVLEFLVRDWPHADYFPYGSDGGELYLSSILKTHPNMKKELREIREHIYASFKQVSCFLMPHPGLIVNSREFKGQTSVMTPEFTTYIKRLSSHTFGPTMLKPKEINGQTLTASGLFNYFSTYVKMFNSKEMPTPNSILQATAEAGLRSAFEECRRLYEVGMESECGPSRPSLPAHDLKHVHDRQAMKALTAFSDRKKMGSTTDKEAYFDDLEKEIENRLSQFVELNIGKIRKTIADAKELYETKTKQINSDQRLCVHSNDLEDIHKDALKAALDLFHKNRRTIDENKKDKDRADFIKIFEKQYDLLKKINDQNNKMLVSEMRLEYWQTLESIFSTRSLSEREFRYEHKKALDHVLNLFDSKRNHPNCYNEDEYKSDLIELIDNCFVQIRALNKSKNKVALQSAFRVYDEHMAAAWDPKEVCLHPSDLDHEHEVAEWSAIAELRPDKACLGESLFDTEDEDEKILSEVLAARFIEIKKNNDSANATAVATAVNQYSSDMYYNCGFSIWWIFGIGIPYVVNRIRRRKYHKECKERAILRFHEARRPNDSIDDDEFFLDLKEKISAIRREYYYIPQDIRTLATRPQ